MTWLPPLRGVIDRRILLNYRIDPDALAAVLPAPFEPRLVDGHAVGGVCCIRLADVRPRPLPAALGIGAENAAHRIGVTWTNPDDGTRRNGVYVPRRDTNSRLTALLGNRTLGRHGHASFDVTEGGGRYRVAMRAADPEASLVVDGTVSDALPADSVFDSVADAVAFHQAGEVGYAPAPDGDGFEGLAVDLDGWDVSPLAVTEARAGWFEANLPADAYELDSALVMTGVGNELRRTAPLSACDVGEAASQS